MATAWTPDQVVFGIRHKRLFGFLSHAGDILDAINSLNGTPPFRHDFFAAVNWPNRVTARAQNRDGNFLVDANIDGVVVTANLEESGLTREQVKVMFERIVRAVLPISNGASTVNRIGIVDRYTFGYDSPSAVAVRALTNLGVIGASGDFKLRVAFRHPTTEGAVLAGVDDWRNTILEVGAVRVAEEEDDEEEEQPDKFNALRVSVDYQHYFAPERRFDQKMIGDHYVAFTDRIAKLQSNELAGLPPADIVRG